MKKIKNGKKILTIHHKNTYQGAYT